MLSRTADHLFWMSRYMERAENTARMLDVNYQTSLLPQSAEVAELGWQGMCLPEKVGGSSMPLVYLGLVLQEAGRALAPLPLHCTAVASLAIDFTDSTPLGNVGGYVYFDTDQNPSTGLPAEALFGLPGQDTEPEPAPHAGRTHAGPLPVDSVSVAVTEPEAADPLARRALQWRDRKQPEIEDGDAQGSLRAARHARRPVQARRPDRGARLRAGGRHLMFCRAPS